MPPNDVADALTREHHVVDSAIANFINDLDRGELRAEPLLEAIRLLRRHIYIEEEFLFPPVRQAGMLMPILVMLREHGQLWRAMDELVDFLKDPVDQERAVSTCRSVLSQLEQHNLKEEPIVYPRAAIDLSAEASAELMRFLHSGHTPDGWICQQAAGR